MKPELLLSVDSERRFWLDPRTKLYMLVIFSIVMIDGKTDGISFWLKPILALVPFSPRFRAVGKRLPSSI